MDEVPWTGSTAAVDALAAEGVHVPFSEPSERVVVRMGAGHRGGGSLPGHSELVALVTNRVDSYMCARSPRLAKAEFRNGLAGYHDDGWERRGVHSLAAFRPRRWVREFTGIWGRSPAGELVERSYGSLTGRLDLVLTAVARRM